MAFQLRQDESIGRGLRRLARSQLQTAARALESPGTDRNKAIHEARRSVKKARAILKVIAEQDRAEVQAERKRLQRVSRRLAPFRDADASVEVLEHLRDRAPDALPEQTCGLVRQALIEDRDQLLQDDASLQKCSRSLRKSARFMKGWRPKLKFVNVGLAIVAARRKGRQAMQRAQSGNRAADFHRWRIAIKTLWYEVRLLAASGGHFPAEIRALKELEDWLGEDHNVVVLCGRVFGDQSLVQMCGELGKLRRAAEQYQKELREKSLAAGRAIYSLDDARYLARVQRQWREWRRGQPAQARAA